MISRGPGAEVIGVPQYDPWILGPHTTRAYANNTVDYRIISLYLKSVASHAWWHPSVNYRVPAYIYIYI